MKKLGTLTALGLSILALSACARPDPNSPSGKRHAAFEEVGSANKSLTAIFEESTPDLAAAAEPVATLKAQAAVLPTLFPAGSGPESDQPTEALAAIWSKPDEFAAEMKRFTDAVAALDAAVADGDGAAARTAHAEFGKTCKSCHDKFRED